MIHIDTQINKTVQIPFVQVTGQTTFAYMVLKDGSSYSLPNNPTFDEISNGLYTFSTVFNETGRYTITIEGEIVAFVRVVEKEMYEVLRDLDDVAQGSWTYNKAQGTLKLIRQDGSTLATFNVTDNADTASRDRQ